MAGDLDSSDSSGVRILRRDVGDVEGDDEAILGEIERLDMGAFGNLIFLARLSILGLLLVMVYLVGSLGVLIFVDDPEFFWEPFFGFLGDLMLASSIFLMMKTAHWHFLKFERDHERAKIEKRRRSLEAGGSGGE